GSGLSLVDAPGWPNKHSSIPIGYQDLLGPPHGLVDLPGYGYSVGDVIPAPSLPSNPSSYAKPL
ncbi:MAG: hypothetical protein F7C08_01165, partial [Desulfurococcales archaeon]|nr:hypothetical protein [Desulfurococcales archaeon]